MTKTSFTKPDAGGQDEQSPADDALEKRYQLIKAIINAETTDPELIEELYAVMRKRLERIS